MRSTYAAIGSAILLLTLIEPSVSSEEIYSYEHSGNLVARHAGLALRTHYRFNTTFRYRNEQLDFKYTFQAHSPASTEMKQGTVYGTWSEEFQQFNVTGASIGTSEVTPASGRCELQRAGSPTSDDYTLNSLACQVEFSDSDVLILKAVANSTSAEATDIVSSRE